MIRTEQVMSAMNACLPAGVTIMSAAQGQCYTRSTEISHWELEYSDVIDLPKRVVAKWSRDPSGSIAREASFYAMLCQRASRACVPRMLGSVTTGVEGVLVLEDVGPGYKLPVDRPSTAAPLHINKPVFEALCAVHSDLWEDAGLREFSIDALADFQAQRLSRQREQILANLAARPDSATSASLLDEVIRNLPETRRAILSRKTALTIIHGDAHPGNFLISSGTPRKVFIIDWPNWQPGPPTDDLAYYLSLCFPPEDRQAQETVLLRHYHDALPPSIREAYPWDVLVTDYRCSIVRCLATAFLWIACADPQQWAWDSLQSVLAAHAQWPAP